MPSNSKPYEEYYVDNDRSIITYMNETYEQNSSQWLQFMFQADIDSRFVAGDQEAIYNYIAANYNYYKRNQVNFNLMRTYINMVTGHQRRTRKASIVVPQEYSDQETADQLSGVLQWVMQKNDGYEWISRAFERTLITGMTLLAPSINYTDDPRNGDLQLDVIDYNAFVIDPFFKKLDLSDCNYIWIRKYASKSILEMMMPGREKELKQLRTDSSRDGKFPYMPENIAYWSRKLYTVDNFWYRDTKQIDVLLDRETGESIPMEGNEETVNLAMQQFPQLEKVKRTVPCVKLAIVVNGKVFVNGANPYGTDGFPFVPCVAYFHPEIPYFQSRIQGVARNLRDSQWIFNRRMRLNLEYLEAGISRGIKYREDALVDPEDAFKTGAGQSLPIKAGHTLDEVQEIPPPQLPPSWFQEIELVQGTMQKIAGINEELLGSADDDKAGILAMLRQGAGLTTLQPLFDNFDYSQKLLGKLNLEMIQNNFSLAKIQRIINKEPTQAIKNKQFLKFDCQVIDGALTPTQQILQFKQLLEMQAAGMQIPPDLLLKNAPLQNKNELIEAIQKAQEQQQKVMMQREQIEQMELAAKAELAKARSAADRGLAVERASRVNENESLAIERRSKATLDEIKALKELKGMNLDQIEKMIQILNALKEEQDIETEQLNPVKSTQGNKTESNESKGETNEGMQEESPQAS